MIAALASVATLAADGSNGRSSVSESWTGPAKSFFVNVAPVEDRLNSFEYDGPLYIDLEVGNILENSVNSIRWTLTMEIEGEEGFVKSGGFAFDSYNGQEDGRGFYGDADSRVGRLCEDENETDGCIPCFVEDGCQFTVSVDLCYADSSTRKELSVRMTQEDGSKFYLSCNDDKDITPCQRLSDWLAMEELSTSESLCTDRD